MVRALRKVKLDGTPYLRRPTVEAEISALERLSLEELVARCALWPQKVTGFVSSEALVYFVRVGNPAKGLLDQLIKLLLERVHRRLPKPDSADGKAASLSYTIVRDHVRDRFVDLLIEDRDGYCERLDYFEVNFDSAMAKARIAVQRQVWTQKQRSTTLGSEDDAHGVSAEVAEAAGSYDPFDVAELDEKNYRRRLDGAIDELPPLQRRIVEMIRREIPIDSSNPNTVTISKTLGKAEKTIRTQRDQAFSTLRWRLRSQRGP